MDEHGEPGGQAPRRPVTAREARDRHRARTPASAGLRFLQELTDRERVWMEGMVGAPAREYHVDAQDLLQELRLDLLGCEVLDRSRESVRAWVRQRTRWRAIDLLRREQRRPRGVPFEPGVPEPVAPEPRGPDPEWTVERLRALGLNRDEAQIALLLCWGADISLRDFAELAERSYAKVRQDRSRGLRKIENIFALGDDESAAFIAFRDVGTFRAAAARLGCSEADARLLVRRAEHKIRHALGHRTGPSTTRDEAETDVC